MIKNNSEDSFSNEFDSSVFIRIGQTLCNNYEQENEEKLILFKTNKTIEDYKREYFVRLDEDIKSFENEKVNILNNIEILSISNKKISDKIKFNIKLLEKLQNKFSIFFTFYEKDNIKDVIKKDTMIYNETFEKITSLYEEIVKIDGYIKRTKSYYR